MVRTHSSLVAMLSRVVSSLLSSLPPTTTDAITTISLPGVSKEAVETVLGLFREDWGQEVVLGREEVAVVRILQLDLPCTHLAPLKVKEEKIEEDDHEEARDGDDEEHENASDIEETDTAKFQCPKCSTTFEDVSQECQEDMRIHLGEAHIDFMEDEMSHMLDQVFPDETSKCEKCGKMFMVEYQKTEHLMIEHPWPMLIDFVEQIVGCSSNRQDHDTKNKGEGVEEHKNLEGIGNDRYTKQVKGMEEMDPDNTPKWYNGIQYKCNHCENILISNKHLKSHGKRNHNVEVSGKFLRKHYSYKEKKYTCKICDTKVKHSGRNIKQHLLMTHNMSTTEYERKYESKTVMNSQNQNKTNILYETIVEAKISRHEEDLIEQLLSESTEKYPIDVTMNETIVPFTSRNKLDQSVEENEEKTGSIYSCHLCNHLWKVDGKDDNSIQLKIKRHIILHHYTKDYEAARKENFRNGACNIEGCISMVGTKEGKLKHLIVYHKCFDRLVGKDVSKIINQKCGSENQNKKRKIGEESSNSNFPKVPKYDASPNFKENMTTYGTNEIFKTNKNNIKHENMENEISQIQNQILKNIEFSDSSDDED